MESKISNEKQLETNIFQVDKGKKKGFKAFLNINSLPQLFTCIKHELTPLENSCLNEYELQNHIIELCFIPNKITKFRTIKELILQEIRNNTKFWILNSDVYYQILERTRQYSMIANTDGMDIEANKKNDEIKHANFEGIDSYLQYISKVSELKRKYQYIQKEYENFEEIEISKDLQKDVIQTNDNKAILEADNNKNIEKNNQELYEKFLQLNDTQRLTRHQKKRLCDDSNMNSQDLSKYINQKSVILRKRREDEIMKSIFMTNRFLKYPKIEFQVFPYIFKFLRKDYEKKFSKKDEFQLQNFLFFLLLQEKQSRKKFRINQNLFSDNQKELKEEILKKNEEILNNEEPALSEFYQFCHNEGFLAENVFFTDIHLKIKQKILLNNILLLGKIYLKQKEELKLKISPLKPISQNSESEYFYKEVLEDLENYENIDENLLGKLIDFYLMEIEYKKYSLDKNNETLNQFLYLNENFEKNTENVMGSFSSIEKINEALQTYDDILNSPTMKKKRAYKFHSEDRGEWNETIYKKFLEGLSKYYDNSINNKKIAKYIGSGISANHVKFVKGRYLRKLKKRSKDLRIMAKELLNQDINNFDMKIFEFVSKTTHKL